MIMIDTKVFYLDFADFKQVTGSLDADHRTATRAVVRLTSMDADHALTLVLALTGTILHPRVDPTKRRAFILAQNVKPDNKALSRDVLLNLGVKILPEGVLD